MLFMVIETFKDANARAAYERFRAHGRMMPDGVEYEGSWVEVGLGRVFQLMRADDAAKLQEWCANWTGVVEFEIVPVVESKDTMALMNRQMDADQG
jgi:hypothetical protein